MTRHGITIPFEGVGLDGHREWFEEVESLGYTDAWSAETNATDGFTPLALAAAWAPSLRLGTAIVPSFTRGPALLAMSIASMAEAAPGRFACGIGTSSDVIVQRWNGIPFDRPYQRTRDVLRFLRKALTGAKVTEEYETFRVDGFRLARPPSEIPPLLVAALRPGMLRLAGREGDGAIINWLSPTDVARVVSEVGPGKEIVARIYVCPSEDADAVRAMGRLAIAAYMNVPVYTEFHRWLGRGDALGPMWSLWQSGDRRGAAAAVPAEVVDDLILHGSPADCRAGVQRYIDHGVTTATLAPLLVPGLDLRQSVRDLGPTAATT